ALHGHHRPRSRAPRRARRAAARALDAAPPAPRGGQHPPRAERRGRAPAPVAGLGGGRAAYRLRPEPAPGAGRPRAADAGLPEPAEERPRAAGRDGRAPPLDPPRGALPHPAPLRARPLPLGADRGHGSGRPRGAPGAALLALLLDQGARHGPGSRRLPPHRQRARGHDRLRAAARRRSRLPRHAAREPGHGAVSAGDASTPGTGSILVADDEESIRWVLERACTQHGHSVVAVASGTAALDQLRRRPFDVALVDIRMPDLSGLDVLKQAREAHIDTLFIIVTAQNTMANAIEATPSWRSTARPSPTSSSRASSSATSAAPSRARSSGASASSRSPRAARSSWTRSPTCRSRSRRRSCACSRSASSRVSAAAMRSG